jgi:hypothetical protein
MTFINHGKVNVNRLESQIIFEVLEAARKPNGLDKTVKIADEHLCQRE